MTFGWFSLLDKFADFLIDADGYLPLEDISEPTYARPRGCLYVPAVFSIWKTNLLINEEIFYVVKKGLGIDI